MKHWLIPTKEFLLSLMLGFAALFVVALLWTRPSAVLLLLLVIAWFLLMLRNERAELVLFALSALWGTTAEVITMFFGPWEYASAHVLGAPYWLPVLWGVAGVFLKRLYDEIQRKLQSA